MQHSPRSLQSERPTGSSYRTDWTSAGLLGYLAVLLALPALVFEPTLVGSAVFGAAAFGILALFADR